MQITKFKHKAIDAPFYIVDGNNTKPLMGLNSCQQINILTINTVESRAIRYDNIFMECGKADRKYTIKLSENAKPTIQPPQKVPLTVLTKLKEILFRKCLC